MPPRNGAVFFNLYKPYSKGGVFTMSKNRMTVGLSADRNSRVVGARRCAPRPRTGVSHNLINGTHKGFKYEK